MAALFDFLMTLWLVWVLLVARIAVHELGHLLAAVYLCLPATRVTIGTGPRLLATTLRSGIGLYIHAQPGGGSVRFIPGMRTSSGRFAAMIAAGPLLELLVLPAAATYVLGLVPGLIFAVAALASFYPRRIKIDGKLRSSDGSRLVRTWRERCRPVALSDSLG